MITTKNGKPYALQGPPKKIINEWDPSSIKLINFHNYGSPIQIDFKKQTEHKIEKPKEDKKEDRLELKIEEDRFKKIQEIISKPIKDEDDYLKEDVVEINEKSSSKIQEEIPFQQPEEDLDISNLKLSSGFPVIHLTEDNFRKRYYASLVDGRDDILVIETKDNIEDGKFQFEHDNSWHTLVKVRTNKKTKIIYIK